MNPKYKKHMQPTIPQLQQAIEQSWDADTCYPESATDWTPDNPALGQCAVTALIVHDYFGGQIFGNRDYHHYWNYTESGQEIDFTRSQFKELSPDERLYIQDIAHRDKLLNSPKAQQAKTAERYELLKSRVDKILSTITAR